MLGEVNVKCITLVPKVRGPSSLGEYMLITCCNVINELRRFSLIRTGYLFTRLSSNQAAIITGRTSDNTLLSHEILHGYHENKGPARCSTKVDLLKAYDIVRWETIEFVLARVGILEKNSATGSRYVSCMETPLFSIMINGSPHGYFGSKSSIRQGDPMSPYLFFVLMDLYYDIMTKSVKDGKFKLH